MSYLDALTPIVPISFLFNAGKQITLQVGEQRFRTTTTTLTAESPFFSALLSGRWDTAQTDGSYFIDVDPDLFKHVLRYLRHSVLPIFYTPLNGHDYALYLLLLAQARYFQITRLEKWLADKKYLQAVKIMHSAMEVEGTDGIIRTEWPNVEIEYHPVWKIEKVYVCPRDISAHSGRPSACGRLCRRAQGDAVDEFVDEEILRTLVVRKQTVVEREEVFMTS